MNQLNVLIKNVFILVHGINPPDCDAGARLANRPIRRAAKDSWLEKVKVGNRIKLQNSEHDFSTKKILKNKYMFEKHSFFTLKFLLMLSIHEVLYNFIHVF